MFWNFLFWCLGSESITGRRLLVCGIAAGLQGCGGGGDELPATVICTPHPTVKIQLFGDSTMFGVDASLGFKQAPNNPGHALQVEMDRRFGAGVVTVENRGVSNSWSTQLLAGTDGLNPPWPQEVDADIIVVNHGINDAQIPTGIEQYKANLRTLAAAAPIVFETPNPGFGRPIEPDAYAQAMREVAEELNRPLADTFDYVMGLPDWKLYVPDGIHPNNTAYGLIVANSLAPVVAPLVTKLRCQ